MIKFVSLKEETLELLQNRPASLKIAKISKDLKISVAWLNLFNRGAIENPGILTIEKLNRYIKNFKQGQN